MIIGIAGCAGSGKSTAASALADRGYYVASLADPIKHICRDVFGWTHDRLWGPSANRNAPDPRWDGLSARRALQTLGTEWGRAMHPDVWVRKLLAEHADRCEDGRTRTVVPDVRFQNELDAIVGAGGLVIHIDRPGSGLEGAAGQHASEQHRLLRGIAGVVVNDCSLVEFRRKVLDVVEQVMVGA